MSDGLAELEKELEVTRAEMVRVKRKADKLYAKWKLLPPSPEKDAVEKQAQAALDEHHSLFRKSEGLWFAVRNERDLEELHAREAKILDGTPFGLSIKRVKGGYEVIHTKSGNRLMPFVYLERELATDFARRAGQVGVDWTRPFSDLQKESEKIAGLIRGGKEPGMFEKVLDMPTTFPKEKDVKKEPWQMTIKQYEKDMRDYWAGTRGTGPGSKSLPDDMSERFRDYHKGLVEQALVDGKPVPAAVLDDYPDLQNQERAKITAKATDDMLAAQIKRDKLLLSQPGLDLQGQEYHKRNIVAVEAELARRKRVEKTAETSLQSIHDSRSLRSKESDERQSNADTIEPDDHRVEQWKRSPGSMDVSGIDTPRKHKGKKVARKTKKSTRTETQVRGIRK